jgi:hypothetical protein
MTPHRTGLPQVLFCCLSDEVVATTHGRAVRGDFARPWPRPVQHRGPLVGDRVGRRRGRSLKGSDFTHDGTATATVVAIAHRFVVYGRRRLGGRKFSVDESWRWLALACANRVLGEA